MESFRKSMPVWILYNFCELVTSHAVVKHLKITKHVYKINFAIAVNICRAYLKHVGNETETMLLIQKYLTPVRYNRKSSYPIPPKEKEVFHVTGCIKLVTIILHYEADMQSVFSSYTKISYGKYSISFYPKFINIKFS